MLPHMLRQRKKHTSLGIYKGNFLHQNSSDMTYAIAFMQSKNAKSKKPQRHKKTDTSNVTPHFLLRRYKLK